MTFAAKTVVLVGFGLCSRVGLAVMGDAELIAVRHPLHVIFVPSWVSSYVVIKSEELGITMKIDEWTYRHHFGSMIHCKKLN